MANSICTRCFHNYVCEQFNEDRDYKNQECRYLNSHFVDTDSVEPVRHGHWISVPHKSARVCSVCEHDEPYKNAPDDADIFNYCPKCGAKMDEVSE